MGDGSNWYVYCGNNPVTHCDFLGLFKVVVRGNDTNPPVPGSGFGYWWTKPSTNPRQGDKEMYRPSRNEVVSNLIGATYFYFWGHGRGGDLKLGEEVLTIADVLFVSVIRRLLGIPKMKKTELRACDSVSTAVAVNVWLLIAEKIEGYPGVTGYFYGPFDWCIYPSLTFTKPINEDPSKNLDDNKRRKKHERINR